jgi:hypothetical protein
MDGLFIQAEKMSTIGSQLKKYAQTTQSEGVKR